MLVKFETVYHVVHWQKVRTGDRALSRAILNKKSSVSVRILCCASHCTKQFAERSSDVCVLCYAFRRKKLQTQKRRWVSLSRRMSRPLVARIQERNEENSSRHMATGFIATPSIAVLFYFSASSTDTSRMNDILVSTILLDRFAAAENKGCLLLTALAIFDYPRIGTDTYHGRTIHSFTKLFEYIHYAYYTCFDRIKAFNRRRFRN